MKKLVIGLIAVVFGLIVAGGATLYKYPYLPAIVEEGFPAEVWPARGIYVQVTGVPLKWPHLLEADDKPVSEAGEKLKRLMLKTETDALVAYHKGKLKYAYFRPGIVPETQFNSYSMAKSVIGYLVMKAIDEGEIDGLDSKIGEYLLMLNDPKLRDEPIRQFLTMRSGLEFESKNPPKPLANDAKRAPDEKSSNPFTPLARVHIQGLTPILGDLKLPEAPTYDYHYQNVNTALLGAMLSAIYTQPLNEILSEKIWKPSGARHARWRTYTHEGAVTAYCCLFATAEDWAKVGIYLMNNGRINNNKTQAPFLAPERNKLMNAEQYSPEELNKGVYGLHVRHDILDRPGEPLQGPFTYFLGFGGQLVYMKPEDDLVVVRFGRRHTLLHSTLYYVWREIMAREAKDKARMLGKAAPSDGRVEAAD